MEHSHEELRKEGLKSRVLTVSTSRDDKTDKSGKIITNLLKESGHSVDSYEVVPDDPAQIAEEIERSAGSDGRVLIITGGTGLSRWDQTVDVLMDVEDKELPGFVELFRSMSYDEIGPRAGLSRARAAAVGDTLVFALPGSPGAVKLGMEKLILPVIGHAIYEMDKEGGADGG